MAKDGGNVVPRITQAEHIGDDDGENIQAKRVVPYVWNPQQGTAGEWERQSRQGLISVAFDRITFSNPNGNTPPNYQTGTVKNNGTTVGTLTLAYDGDGTLTDVRFVAV